MTAYAPDFFTVIVVGALGFVYLYERFVADDEPEEGTVEHAEHLWETDQIPLAEYERRVERAVDDRHQQILTVAQSINDVGPKTARALAVEFESLDELHRADRERIEDIHGIGPSTADAIEEYLER
ncbi:helix-hairpin-helix domain-containing protein [Halorubrum sp. CSM-61]|uniref:helix-hairpin-helix domain-containing protein n=1 Tax=Halorubrum sp. CSM-61 TaxID=2485838 RepID=UPI000F4B26D5|nr:helix-hairpin-helix domain-containing protein [Halorubrum sp. CSM-61]